MSLLKQQNFLAKLYTDAQLRSNFTFDPLKIGSENELSVSEIGEISEIFAEEINFFAESLFRKRLNETGKLLPLTKAILKADFSVLYHEFSQNNQFQTIKKHFEDATEFCRFVQKSESISAIGKDVAKYEAAKLRFFAGGEKFVFCYLKFNVREISTFCKTDENSRLPKIPKKIKLFVWIRLGKNIKYIDI